jgi:predicted DNA-binding protein (MmcQ/YjbR family)
MLNFENIPLKVSLNEYIDISKDYSTPKSKLFINGILDKLVIDFKRNGKIFLITGFDEPLKINVKCNPEQAVLLRETYNAVLPGYHMNKMHWNTIILDGSIPKKILCSFIDQSYDLVGPKPKKKKV